MQLLMIVYDASLIDTFIKSNDTDSFKTARQLVADEGLLCGGSCGAAVAALLEAAQTLKPGQKALAILPDSIRNYLGKYINNDWLKANGFEAIIEPNPIFATKEDIHGK